MHTVLRRGKERDRGCEGLVSKQGLFGRRDKGLQPAGRLSLKVLFFLMLLNVLFFSVMLMVP